MKLSAISFVAAAFSVLVSGADGNLLRRRTNTVCSAAQIAELDCDIADDVVGVYVCRGSATTCVDPSAIVSTDTCGCCAGDNRADCLDDTTTGGSSTPGSTVNMNGQTLGSMMMNSSSNTTNSTMFNTTASANGVCTAFQVWEFDCDIRDDVVGVKVCRNEVTTCEFANATLATDTCGCCPGDTSPGCEAPATAGGTAPAPTPAGTAPAPTPAGNPAPTPATNTASANGVCSASQVTEFDCDISNDVVGVFVCRNGATTCSLASDTLSTDTCGCCAGDTQVGCEDDGDAAGGAPAPAPAPGSNSANSVCSAFQLTEFDCDISDDVVGVFVCRNGATTCVLPSDTLAADTCGCCAGDNRPVCLDLDDDATAVARAATDDFTM